MKVAEFMLCFSFTKEKGELKMQLKMPAVVCW